ncbi:hybrid sensor histidine kinase/response regulator transcription factor [Geofilum sp. OHC36d9]|uniref:hybrid sensor histidine kinase/response regulator transcription factor n=1 Tax=Geofilum sp. OHC36d9 TaxID=3458413 RepID=UPI004034F49C
MKFIIACIIFIALSINTNANTEPSISLTRVTPEGGVTYNSIMCIAEDEMGFIWFGSNDGLYRYNSIDFKRYSHFQNDTNSIATNRINKLHKDLYGRLWIATENGLCLYNRKQDNFSSYTLKDQFGNLSGKDINSFFQTKDSTYWFSDEKGFGTLNIDKRQVFYKNIDGKTNKVSLITNDDQGSIWVFYTDGEIYYKLKDSDTFYYFSKAYPQPIHSSLIDKDKLWIAYETNGLLCLNLDGSVQTYFKSENNDQTAIPDNQVRSIVKDELGQIWAATYEGIAIIKNNEVISVINPQNYSEMPSHSVWSLFQDSQKNIWFGTFCGGLCFHSKHSNYFNHQTQSSSKNSLSFNIVSSFTEVPNSSKIIVGTEDGNLNYFDPISKKITQTKVTYNGISVSNIKSLCFDKNGTLWVGTYSHGVLYQTKSSTIFKKLTPPFTEGFQALYLLATDEGLWVSNYPNGAYFYNFETNKFTQFIHNPLNINTISNNNVRQILEDKHGNIWFGTRNGLNLLKKGSQEIKHFFHEEYNSTSLSSNFIYSMLEDDEGNLWIGTNGEGLDYFNTVTYNTDHYTTKDGLTGNEIFSMLQDKNNRLWLTTNQGLCLFEPKSKTIRSFNNTNGILNNKFNPNSAICSNDVFYFGGTNGFIRFQPENITKNLTPPTTIITELYVNNELVIPGEKTKILDDVIEKTRYLKLNYTQNSIGFRFVTNNYIDPSKNRFKYRLIGFNDDWINIEYNETATFTKIPPGDYTFEVKAANNDGVWNKNSTKIFIEIIPPYWLRWYAYVTYILAFLIILYFIRKQSIKQQILKSEIELERINRKNKEKLHQLKLQFFTNISHEFRTPLTLIQGPVNHLLKNEAQPEESYKQLQLIKNNTDRLLRLINQFLDFRKVNSEKLQLNPVNAEIIAFCRNIYSCFEENAKIRNIKFNFVTDLSKLKMDFDPDKVDKLLFNLLSNAFKHTPDGGEILLEIYSNAKHVSQFSGNTYSIGEKITNNFLEITVSDSGNGIPEKHLAAIFERFYQINDTRQGTGIGLSLAKNYILAHKGTLIVNSQVNTGTEFTIYLPQNQSESLQFNNSDETIETTISNYSVQNTPAVNEKQSFNKEDEINENALVLIVEDNVELLNYISDILKNYFRVAKARNGKLAMEQVNTLFPDLVISDIMMPEMDGIELCDTLKTDIKTSHIPVILLTALDSVKDRITGLNSGADAYLGKPFDEQLLIAQINSLLESRRILRQSFDSNRQNWEDQYSSFDLDKKLLLKAVSVVEANISDPDLSVQKLAEQLNLSRTHLYRKLKTLTNQSATEFIRNIRLKNAIKLMDEGKLKINEIGYAVGFNSHNYFTRSFKKQYGISPSEYIQDKSRRNH